MKIVGQEYPRRELDRGDVFRSIGFDTRYIVVSNDGVQRNNTYSGAAGQYKCVLDDHYYWAAPEYRCIFVA